MTSHTQAEHALVKALAAGEKRAFNELVGRYHRSLVRLAPNFVRSEAIAEEVVQDTWHGVIAGDRTFSGALLAQDLDLRHLRQQGANPRGARTPHDPLLVIGGGGR